VTEVAQDTKLAQDALRLRRLTEGVADLLDGDLVRRRVPRRPNLAVWEKPAREAGSGTPSRLARVRAEAAERLGARAQRRAAAVPELHAFAVAGQLVDTHTRRGRGGL